MSRRGLFLFALLSLLWGIPYLMIKVAVAEVSVPFLVFARSAIGAAVLLPIAFRVGGWTQVMRHWAPVTAFAVVEMIVPWALLSHGEIRLTSATAGLLIAATPILAMALGKGSRESEPLSWQRVAGLALGFAGVLVLAAPKLGGDLASVVEVLLAAVCYAAGSLIAARWLSKIAALPMTAACLALSALVYLAPAVATWPEAAPSTRATAAIVALGILCTALAFTSFFLLIREVGAERAVIITYIAPAVAVAAGVLLLGEPLSGRTITSFALILGGSYLATAPAKPRVIPSAAVPGR